MFCNRVPTAQARRQQTPTTMNRVTIKKMTNQQQQQVRRYLRLRQPGGPRCCHCVRTFDVTAGSDEPGVYGCAETCDAEANAACHCATLVEPSPLTPPPPHSADTGPSQPSASIASDLAAAEAVMRDLRVSDETAANPATATAVDDVRPRQQQQQRNTQPVRFVQPELAQQYWDEESAAAATDEASGTPLSATGTASSSSGGFGAGPSAAQDQTSADGQTLQIQQQVRQQQQQQPQKQESLDAVVVKLQQQLRDIKDQVRICVTNIYINVLYFT